ITDRSIITRYGSKSVYNIRPDEYATSILKSRSGKFIINHAGIFINTYEIEELGYWSEQRVARLLPTNFTPGAATPPSPFQKTYLAQLASLQQQNDQEKIYLFPNKPYYSTRDAIWFSTFLVDANTHRPVTTSAVVYVDLIDPAGKIVDTRVLHRAQTMAADFSAELLQEAGIYHLRAYTNRMREAGKDFLYYRSVAVYDPGNLGAGALVGRRLSPSSISAVKSDYPFEIAIHPEGGALLAGAGNNVVVRVLDTEGRPLSLTGTVVNSKGKAIEQWQTGTSGMALIPLKPKAGDQYQLEFVHTGQTYQVPLPEPQQKGVSIRLDNLADDNIRFRVIGAEKQSLEGAFLVGHVRGEVFFSLSKLAMGERMSFPREQIPAGLASLSVYDRTGQLLSQRLFYNDRPISPVNQLTISTPYAYFRPRQEVVVDLGWLDSLNAQGATLTASILDKDLVAPDLPGQEVQWFLPLSAELTTQYTDLNPNKSLGEQEREQVLDLRLAAVPAAAYRWHLPLRTPKDSLRFPPEQLPSVRGYITRRGKPDQRVKAEVLLTALHPQPTILKTITDAAGNFEFSNLPYLDSVDYVLQAAQYKEGATVEIPMLESNKRNVAIHLYKREPAPLTDFAQWPRQRLALPEQLVPRFARTLQETTRLDSLYGADWQIDLAEVTVSAQRIVDARNYDVYDLNRLDWVQPDRPAYQLLTTLKPGNKYVREVSRNQLAAVVNNGKGKMIRVPVTIIIDGFEATFNRFESLRANMIDYIIINKLSVIVKTRPSPREEFAEDRPGWLTFRHPGFYPGRPFPAPNYASRRPEIDRPDVRTTIHWEPNFRLEANQTKRLTFYAADTPTEYVVKVVGVTDGGEMVHKTFIISIRE
ncbi:MAG: hypothetical protein AAF840_10500, partial [Bacteroidota bacterium]